jgi:PBP1b-binding outer membrane lipoprotein LpoB
MKYALMIICCALILSGCAGSDKAASTAQKDADMGSPESTVEKFAQALAKNDVDAALALYAPEVFKLDGATEAQAKQIMAEQLRNGEVPVFANGTMKVEKVTRYAQVDYTVGGKVRHLVLKETPEGWRISNSMIAE